LDAQFWGVAQRRRRCYIVVDFTGERAGQILFDESRLQRDSSPSGAARQGSAGDFTDRVGIPSGINGDVAGTLDANYFKGTGARNGVERDVVAFEPGATSRMKSNYAYTEVCGTLRAKMGDNQAAVAIPINTQVGLRNHKDGDGTGLGVGIADSPAYTLQAAHSHAVAIENHPADSRIKVSEDGIVQTLPGRMGTGGGNVPLVMNDSAVRAYGISSYESNAMKSPNPHSGVYEADTSKTLDTLGGRPDCRQGGVAVVAVQGSMIGRKDENGPQGSGINENISFTLTGTDKHAVCYQDSIGTLCASDYKFPQQQQIEEGKAVVEQVTFGKNGFGRWNDKPAALKASGGDFPGGENIVVENRYVVRRLTPQECALLQGFPVDWCSGLETPEPTEEDIAFWTEVWETDRLIKGTSSKPKSRKQIIKWLKDPHSDSAEYKMWGNGVALPCVEFVLSGIVHFA
jgi:DNA (cytosine-5)-methyltransferase 1